MRLNIISTDRLGITQEILTVLAEHACDIVAMEVVHNHIYLHLNEEQYDDSLSAQILAIDGVHGIEPIFLLPGERQTQQLQALFAKIPEPIIDIDKQGRVISANEAALAQVNMAQTELVGKTLQQFIKQRLRIYLNGHSTTQEVNFAGNDYYADITPVKSDNQINGAVIILRSIGQVGRQLSQYQQGTPSGLNAVIGESVAMCELKQQLKRFANLPFPVMLTGETGTGKELLAKGLHDSGQRASKPFLAINCAAMPEHLLEAELFGYAPGAFTDAKRGGKPGLLELADGGSVFLDEIAEMTPQLQAKLLRFLQDLRLRRLGDVKDKKVDVRIISATHQDLPSLVDKGIFRQDLLYRLNVLQLSLPPLRQRGQDIELLIEHFLNNAAIQVNRPTMTLSEQAMEQLLCYQWPGNIRQLQNVIYHIAATTDSQIVEYIPSQVLGAQDQPLTKVSSASLETADNISNQDIDKINSWQQAQQDFERNLLTKLYPLYPSTRKLAQRLNVSHNTIAIKLRAYDIQPSR
ncbi:sigma 54-interacting transcriptional regulator [Thalassotalea maritima]|uniref:sigma 54-interacting transcriptional regulator n=1 Tax=Thalassotalea maritima TaxID=3242416 RepID=UPI003529C9AF